jgi:hypothetical protein
MCANRSRLWTIRFLATVVDLALALFGRFDSCHTVRVGSLGSCLRVGNCVPIDLAFGRFDSWPVDLGCLPIPFLPLCVGSLGCLPSWYHLGLSPSW